MSESSDELWRIMPEFVDFHSHVLPHMDDGSKSAQMSVDMLLATRAQGLTRVIATPHFYPFEDNPAAFLARRAQAVNDLEEAKKLRRLASVTCGAEVAWYDGLHASSAVKDLVIGDTPLVLVEMPMKVWSQRMLESLVSLQRRGYVPVLAHVERYLGFVSVPTLCKLKCEGVLIQCNASFFMERRYARHAKAFLTQGIVDFIGSDMHNVTDRPQRMGTALEKITETWGLSSLDHVREVYDQWFPLQEPEEE